MNGVSVCLNEIALEGLDGITISTLWRRMEAATIFSVVDESYKQFLWRCIRSSEYIETYLLEEPRMNINGIADERKAYPYHCIIEEDIRGSCFSFKSRSKISVSDINLATAKETYGNRLVLVASQLLRNKVLFGQEFDFGINISHTCYCLLEIIGRSRKLGCLHSDLGICAKIDSKSLFHVVKTLLKLDLITKQSVVARRNLATSILYLKRFHTEHTFDSIYSKISSSLNKAKDSCLSLETLQDELGESRVVIDKAVKELLKSGHVRYIVKDSPNVDQSSGELDNNGSRVVQSVHVFHNLSEEETDEYEDEEWAQPENQELSMNIPAELPIMHAVYNFLASKGENGASLSECCESLSFPYFTMRKTLTDMECLQYLYCKFVDVRKTKMNVYFVRNDVSPKDKQSIPSTSASLVNEVSSTNTSSTSDITHMESENLCSTLDEISEINQSSSVTSLSPLSISEELGTSSTSAKMQGNRSFDSGSKSTTNVTTHAKPSSRNRSRAEKTVECESFVRRKQLILKMLNNAKVVEGFYPIKNMILSEEKKMGFEVTMDRRSVVSILDVLIDDECLRKISKNVQINGSEHSVDFFCHPTINEESQEFTTCLRRFKDRIIIKNATGTQVFCHDKTVETAILPKCPRVEALHMFLYCIIYELRNPNVDLEALRKKYEWAEYLSQEHVLANLGKGWFTPYTALMLLPVSLYVKLVRCPLYNVVIRQYYNDLSTRNMLLKDLPPVARYILYNPRNDFLFGCFEFLVYFGLITPSNKNIFFHERDIACYLHRCAKVKDTRISEPAYDEVKHPNDEEFAEETFVFNTMADVEQYWETVRSVCVETPLNKRSGPSKKPRPRTHPKNLANYIVDQKEISEYATLPGDGLGAAGFDSQIYVHLAHKWKLSLIEKREKVPKMDEDDDLKWQNCFANDPDVLTENSDVSSGKKINAKRKRQGESKGTKKKQQKVEDRRHVSADSGEVMATPQQSVTVISNVAVNPVETKTRRKKKNKKKKSETNLKSPRGHWSKKIHDARDEEALRMKEVRNKFSPQQMKLLFICSVALRIIGKKSTDTGYKDWLWTRDVLYNDDYESSKTKTALSISRKYTSMFKNAQTKKNLEICVADCLQEKQFQPYINVGKNCNEAIFNELVELLKKKYSMQNMVGNGISLPRTLQEFSRQKNSEFSCLEVEHIDKCDADILTLESREATVAEIRQRIIRDAIVSALLLSSDHYKSHVAFRFLSQFTEEELIIAISLLKNARIVVRKQLRYTKSGYDLASCAFSQMLSSHGQRVIDNHFSSLLMNDVKLFYDKMSHSSMLSEVEERFLPVRLSDGSIHGGKVHCIFALLSSQRLAVNMRVPNCFLSLANTPNTSSGLSGKDKEASKKNEDCMTSSILVSSSQDSPSQIVHGKPVTITDEGPFCAREDILTSNERDETTNEEMNDNEEGHCKDGNGRRKATSKESKEKKVHTNEEMFEKVNVNETRSGDVISDEEVAVLSGNVNRKHHNDMLLDVLCGIEDHLFGSLFVECESSLYKAVLKPTSSFTCTITTPAVDHIRTSGGNHDIVNEAPKSSLQDKHVYERYLKRLAHFQRTGDANKIYFSINPCNVEVCLSRDIEEYVSSNEDHLGKSVKCHFISNGLKIPQTIDECVMACSKTFGYSGDDCKALKAVYETISSSKEIGMSSYNVKKLMRERNVLKSLSVDGLIKVLEAFSLVYKVGFVEVCYVAKTFKYHWFLNIRESPESLTCSNKRNENRSRVEESNDISIQSNAGGLSGDMISSINDQFNSGNCEINKNKNQVSCETQTETYSEKLCRPWITMSGEVNKNAYNDLHRSVLAYIMKYPGVQKYTISKHFLNLMYPIAIDDILTKLEECECVERHVCLVMKTSLFSSRTQGKSTYYHSKPDALFKLIRRVFL